MLSTLTLGTTPSRLPLGERGRKEGQSFALRADVQERAREREVEPMVPVSPVLNTKYPRLPVLDAIRLACEYSPHPDSEIASLTCVQVWHAVSLPVQRL